MLDHAIPALHAVPQAIKDIAQKGIKPARKSNKTSANGVRPVDQSQASKGKLDYVKVWICGSCCKVCNLQSAMQLYHNADDLNLVVTTSSVFWQVKDWGTGEPADLGSLEVESFSPDLFSDHSKPFYEQLARRLEELQVFSKSVCCHLHCKVHCVAAAAAAAATGVAAVHCVRVRHLTWLFKLFCCCHSSVRHFM